MQGPYRPLTLDQRADHIEALILLGRLVTGLPSTRALQRTFVVMSAVQLPVVN